MGYIVDIYINKQTHIKQNNKQRNKIKKKC